MQIISIARSVVNTNLHYPCIMYALPCRNNNMLFSLFLTKLKKNHQFGAGTALNVTYLYYVSVVDFMWHVNRKIVHTVMDFELQMRQTAL